MTCGISFGWSYGEPSVAEMVIYLEPRGGLDLSMVVPAATAVVDKRLWHEAEYWVGLAAGIS